MTPAEIKQARIKIFETQAKAARYFNVAQSAWCKWELGTRKMPRFYSGHLKMLMGWGVKR